MRKIILLPILIIIFFATACRPRVHKTTGPERPNQLIRDANGNADLYGISTEEGMKQPPFSNWYAPNYNGYAPDSSVIISLRPLLRNKTIQVFMGTWCGDSRREVPRMLKVLNLCGMPPASIQIINVGHGEEDYKQSPTHEERGRDIHHVPTFIVYQAGKELNRIVETPVVSIERDLLRILNGEDYIPKYAAAARMLQWYSRPGWEQQQQDSTLLAGGLRKMVLHRGELDGLGRMQLACGDTGRALFTLRVNTMLFPEDPQVWRNFAKALLRKGDTTAANHCLEKAERYARQ